MENVNDTGPGTKPSRYPAPVELNARRTAAAAVLGGLIRAHMSNHLTYTPGKCLIL